MLAIVQADQYSLYAPQIDAMYRLRADVFGRQLGWDVHVLDGRERDDYDDLSPLYLLSLTGNGTLRGSVRFLPTTGPNMLSDVFCMYFNEELEVRSPTIWEATRFCVDQSLCGERLPNGLNWVTMELLTGMCEVGMMAGLTQVTAVFDPLMARIYRAAGLKTHVVGRSRRDVKGTLYVGVWDIGEETLNALKSKSIAADGRHPDEMRAVI
jgi:acyl homoserine lactone synthase